MRHHRYAQGCRPRDIRYPTARRRRFRNTNRRRSRQQVASEEEKEGKGRKGYSFSPAPNSDSDLPKRRRSFQNCSYLNPSYPDVEENRGVGYQSTLPILDYGDKSYDPAASGPVTFVYSPSMIGTTSSSSRRLSARFSTSIGTGTWSSAPTRATTMSGSLRARHTSCHDVLLAKRAVIICSFVSVPSRAASSGQQSDGRSGCPSARGQRRRLNGRSTRRPMR